ncbi:MAG: hypothetical protein KAT11_01310 [Phycisphaerae bacterium]|nr:hypothetical protein [Phycisphaerae bacterium]
MGERRKDALNEKEAIERATAGGFLKLYNAQMDSSYEIVEHSDAPEFICLDRSARELRLEITLTEDRPGDIQAALGRSDARDLESLKRHLEAVRQGEESIFDRVSCLQGNVLEMIKERIRKKLDKDYGPNTALVIRDTSPLDWDWSHVSEQIRMFLDSKRNPYDKGIWIISSDKDRIFQVL